MAFLQEPPRSLRAYLPLVGILGAVGETYQVVLSSEAGPFTRLLALIGIVISDSYIWVGVPSARFSRRRSPNSSSNYSSLALRILFCSPFSWA